MILLKQVYLRGVLPCVALILCACWSAPSFAFSGYQTELETLYGTYDGVSTDKPLRFNSGFSASQQACSQCHQNDPADDAWNPFGNAVRAEAGAIADRIRDAAESGSLFVPKVTGTTSFRVPANAGAQTVDLNYSAGRDNVSGATSTVSGTGNFKETQISGGFPFTFNTSGDLAATSTLAAGSVYSFTIAPKNAAGFHPITAANQPTVTVTVNTPPSVVQAAVNAGSFDDNDGVIASPNLASSTYFTDADAGDIVEGVDGSASVTALRDQDGATVPLGTYTITPTFTGGVLSFNPTDLDALGNGESLTVTFTYSVRDRTGSQTLDTVTNTYTVTVDGVPESGTNIAVAATPRSLTLSEDDVTPVSTNLLNNDAGTAFTDADGDALSVDRFITSLAANPEFSLAGDVFSVVDLADYQSLSAGQSESFDFTYVIEELRDGGPERYETTNTLNVTINGANDPVTAGGFAVELDETIILSFVDVIGLSGASDPDADDDLIATNLRDITPNRPLRNPDQLKISDDGKTLQISAAFDENLDEGDTAGIEMTLDITDGSGSSVPITISFTITGQAAGHGASAGLYANSLVERYGLSDFQAAASQPAACFTCHTPAADLFSAKPNCNDTVDFTPYGARLCNDNRGGAFGPRMANAESFVAPQILIDNLTRELSSDAGATDPDPIPVDPGRTVDGATSTLHSFYLEDDLDGGFVITPDGIVQSTRPLDPGEYVLKTYPRNIAGSKDASGALRNVAGFYPRNAGLTTITVLITEALPILADDTANVESGSDVVIPVGVNDTEGGLLRTIAVATEPGNGTATIGADLTITYTPDAGFTGTDSFTYSGSNISGDAADVATVTIEVIAEGDLVAQADVATTAIGKAISVPVLANDLNAQADSTVVTLVAVPDAATVGETTVSGQNILFTPVGSFSGTTQITYAAVNPSGSSSASQASVTINVVEVGTGAITAALDDPQLKQTAAAFEASCSIVASSADTGDDVAAFLNTCAVLNNAAAGNENLQQAIKALQNEENLAAVTSVRDIARGLGRAVAGRMANIRDGGARGFDFDGLNISLGGQRVPTDLLVTMAQSAVGIRKPRFRADTRFADVNPIWGGFISGEIAFTEKDSNSTGAGFDLITQNLVVGADYDMRDGRYLGLAIGYSEADTDFANGSALRGKGLQASVYGVVEDFMRPGVTLEGYISLGRVKFDSARRIVFTTGAGAVDTTANASFDVDYINISPRLSYTTTNLNTGDRLGDLATGMRVTWFGQLDLLLMQMDGYSETGGAGLALSTQGETYKSLLLTLGVDLSRPIYVGPNATAEIFGTLSLNGELLDKTRSLTSSFAVAGPGAPTFTVSEDGAHGIGGTIEIGTKLTSRRDANTEIRLGHDFSSDGVRTTRLGVSWSKSLFGQDRLALGYDRSLAARGTNNWNANLDYQLDF